jgi:hypothetical protein
MLLLPSMPLTKEDFDASDWQSILAGSGKMTCFEFATDLLQASLSAGEADRAKKETVLWLLGYLAQLLFAHDSGNAVYVTAPVNVPKDNGALDILTEDHLDAIALVVEDTRDPEMRARLADVLWLKRRKPVYARLAVDSFLGSITRLEDDWPSLADRRGVPHASATNSVGRRISRRSCCGPKSWPRATAMIARRIC